MQLDDTVFNGPARFIGTEFARMRCAAMTEVDVRPGRLNLRLARFAEGGIRAGGGVVFAEKVRLGASSLISGSGELPLRDTDVSNLEVADVGLRWYEFTGAHRLDQLRLAGRGRVPLRRDGDAPPLGRRAARARGAGGTGPGQALVSRRGPCAARPGPRRAVPP